MLNIRSRNRLLVIMAGITIALSSGTVHSREVREKPNLVLVHMDNFGYGEPCIYGGGVTRGAPTPRIDALAAEGLRLTNFNVEAQCTDKVYVNFRTCAFQRIRLST